MVRLANAPCAPFDPMSPEARSFRHHLRRLSLRTPKVSGQPCIPTPGPGQTAHAGTGTTRTRTAQVQPRAALPVGSASWSGWGGRVRCGR